MTIGYYEIRVKGLLDPSWSDWFNGMMIAHDMERGETLLSGTLVDETALYSVLTKARDLSLTLISVHPVEDDKPS